MSPSFICVLAPASTVIPDPLQHSSSSPCCSVTCPGHPEWKGPLPGSVAQGAQMSPCPNSPVLVIPTALFRASLLSLFQMFSLCLHNWIERLLKNLQFSLFQKWKETSILWGSLVCHVLWWVFCMLSHLNLGTALVQLILILSYVREVAKLRESACFPEPHSWWVSKHLPLGL